MPGRFFNKTPTPSLTIEVKMEPRRSGDADDTASPAVKPMAASAPSPRLYLQRDIDRSLVDRGLEVPFLDLEF